MFNIFKTEETKKGNNHPSIIAVACLLVHSARIDENYTAKEKKIIKDAIIEMGAETKNIDKIIKIIRNSKNPDEAKNICNKFREFNSKGISASDDKAIEFVSKRNKLTPVNAEIFSIYVIGLHCPDII